MRGALHLATQRHKWSQSLPREAAPVHSARAMLYSGSNTGAGLESSCLFQHIAGVSSKLLLGCSGRSCDGPVAVSPFVTIKYSPMLNRREIFLLSYCLKKILHEFRVKKFVYLGTSDRV